MCCERILHVSTSGVSPPRERELRTRYVRVWVHGGGTGARHCKKWTSEASPTSCNHRLHRVATVAVHLLATDCTKIIIMAQLNWCYLESKIVNSYRAWLLMVNFCRYCINFVLDVDNTKIQYICAASIWVTYQNLSGCRKKPEIQKYL